MPGWLTLTLRQAEQNLGGFGGYTYEKTDTLLSEFDRHVNEAKAALAAAKDADFDGMWSLKMGDRVLLSLPRPDKYLLFVSPHQFTRC